MAGETVWVIDDFESSRMCAAAALAGAGYSVVQFQEPYEAARRLSAGEAPPHAALCDLFFDDDAILDGIQFYSVMAPQLERTAKFVYTGEGVGEDSLRELGVQVIAKPARLAELVKIVGNGIERMGERQQP